ncbi:hypothetical protein FHS42_002373 [Streptomyces zagrosensis]|uniref:Uncharacterized protein n=1 Tax=Streptomyces zagrosensis TaxID=1042984 RepID=A0A7W9UYG4_9ACTN|nr:hypothetical protein [Streptomyces zagrosensis]
MQVVRGERVGDTGAVHNLDAPSGQVNTSGCQPASLYAGSSGRTSVGLSHAVGGPVRTGSSLLAGGCRRRGTLVTDPGNRRARLFGTVTMSG